MITEKDIETRLAEILTDAGFNVVANEVNEGYDKPAVFVTVYPSTVTAECCDMEDVVDSIEIKYIPAVETVEECADTAVTLKRLFMHKPFDVSDRRLTIESMEFEIEEHILYVYFDLEYRQLYESDDEYDTMEILEMGGDI